MKAIYLDNNATTQLAPEVRELLSTRELLPLNPSSIHTYGQIAKKELTAARESIARHLGCHMRQLIFTSGGTESLNLAVQGLLKRPGNIVTTKIEHHALLKPIHNSGREIIEATVGKSGAPSLDAIEQAINSNTALIALSGAYSETGALLDLKAISTLALNHGIPLLIDGVALLGKVPITLYPGISAMAFSGHKVHAPKGIGLLYVEKGNTIKPLIQGGFQERGLRGGTENLDGAIGLARALELQGDMDAVARLRDRLEEGLKSRLDITIHGSGPRLPNTTNICFHGVEAETLLILLDRAGVYASQGSACSSGSLEPSHVLLGMGIDRSLVKSSLRFSLSRYTSAEEIERAIQIVSHTVETMLLPSLTRYTTQHHQPF